MKILAFDQATSITGYSVFIDGNLTTTGVIDLHKTKDTTVRIEMMMLNMIGLIKQISPDLVVIEDVAMQSNAGALVLLSRLQGGVMGHCYANSVALMIIKPTEWRKWCGFTQGRVKRPELKKQAIAFALEHFGLTLAEDEADAACIGFAVTLMNAEG